VRPLWHTSPMPILDLTIRSATEADLSAINAIYNREILEGVATWDIYPWSEEQRRAWLAEHSAPGLVALVADLPDVPVAGFGYLSVYQTRGGFRFTREDTVYVRPEHQGRGIGRALLAALLEEARRLEVHAVVARIEATNEASIALHRALGFQVTGEERETGHKFGTWRSLVQMQIVLGEAP
jgi:L-amino acid N-acyltransferase YncA